MTVAWARARALLRSRWRQVLALALFTGAAGGLVMGIAVAARRTSSVYDRFIEASHGSDVLIPNYPDPGVAVLDPDDIASLPHVRVAAVAQFEFANLGGRIPAYTPVDDEFAAGVDRHRFLRGRAPRPDAATEVSLAFPVADDLGLDVGDTYPAIDPEQVAGAEIPPSLLRMRFRVVGIHSAPFQLPGQIPAVLHSRAARDLFGADAPQAIAVDLEDPDQDIAAFRAALAGLAGEAGLVPMETARDAARNTQRSLRTQAVGLFAVAGVAAAVLVVVLTQALLRFVSGDDADTAVARGLGASRMDLSVDRAIVGGAVGLVAAGFAIAMCLASTLVTAGGLTRTIDPDRGLYADTAVLATGATVVVILVTAGAGACAVFQTSRLRAGKPAVPRRSTVVRLLGRSGAPPTVVVGTGFAFSGGPGRTAVPTASAILAVTVGVLALAAAAIFGASLHTLLTDHARTGWPWDLVVTHFGEGTDTRDPAVQTRLRADPDIVAFGVGDLLGGAFSLGGRDVPGLVIDAEDSLVLPQVLQGRNPRVRGEVALGSRTLADVDTRIGEEVRITSTGGRTAVFRVVGTVVIPPHENGGLGRGMVLTNAGAERLAGPHPPPASSIFVILAPGADPNEVAARLSDLTGTPFPLDPLERREADELVNFGRVEKLPSLAAALLALIGIATLSHVLITGIRSRRRDLAILRGLGWTGRQVQGSVAASAVALGSVAVIIGVPLGIAGGRLAWEVFVHQLGVDSPAVAPADTLAALGIGTILAAALICWFPGRAAGRWIPAETLRTE